uniref:Uncharacterized protein n=1 Tax=Physcomitrium patens TaxID=3218 RepID=A0A2K1KD57_PHYPA|nr:hypothetical protein PHYPA_010902 [Physcomitrium patens]
MQWMELWETVSGSRFNAGEGAANSAAARGQQHHKGEAFLGGLVLTPTPFGKIGSLLCDGCQRRWRTSGERR